MPNSPLIIRAGKRALEHIRSSGLNAADIEIIPGAAGGPKALGISGLDRAIFGDWLPSAPVVRHLIGASIGAWRFACACRTNPRGALDEFARAYTEQGYPQRPSRQFVSQTVRTMLGGLFTGREEEILSHPHYRLHILAVRGRWPLTRDSNFSTSLGFGMAAMANVIGRRHLARFIDRTVFHDPRDHPAFFKSEKRFDAFRTHAVTLDRANLGEALLASASIPLLFEGVANVPGGPAGVYWDGGIIDYNLHLPYHHSKGLVFYPHFTDRIMPGWLDKGMPWRRARGEWLDNMILVAPTREYLVTLPHGRLPNRTDFKRYLNDDAGRVKSWRTSISESDRLAEAFYEFVKRPDPSRVLPL